MFPWNYGFHFGIASYMFLGAFYTVLLVVAATLAYAFWRAHRTLRSGAGEHIRWHSDFHDLPAADRVCRHVLTGEFQRRECPHAFDCRECTTHEKLVAASPETTRRGEFRHLRDVVSSRSLLSSRSHLGPSRSRWHRDDRAG